jgi:hypothetical protein
MNMKGRCYFVLSILAVLLMTFGNANAWPIKSKEKLQTAKEVLTVYVREIAENDNYFDSYLVNAYVDGLMKSINKNNGQGIIISHDALKWCKFTLALYDDENIRRVDVARHRKNFKNTLKKLKIDQDKLQDIVRQFNTSGYAYTSTADGSLVYYYEYSKDCFMAKVTPAAEEIKQPLPPVEKIN